MIPFAPRPVQERLRSSTRRGETPILSVNVHDPPSPVNAAHQRRASQPIEHLAGGAQAGQQYAFDDGPLSPGMADAFICLLCHAICEKR